MTDLPIRSCRSCGAPVIWTTTTAGKRMPVDPEPIESGAPPGNVRLTVSDGLARSEVLGPLELEAMRPPERETLHTSHFATCPQADRWRQA